MSVTIYFSTRTSLSQFLADISPNLSLHFQILRIAFTFASARPL